MRGPDRHLPWFRAMAIQGGIAQVSPMVRPRSSTFAASRSANSISACLRFLSPLFLSRRSMGIALFAFAVILGRDRDPPAQGACGISHQSGKNGKFQTHGHVLMVVCAEPNLVAIVPCIGPVAQMSGVSRLHVDILAIQGRGAAAPLNLPSQG